MEFGVPKDSKTLEDFQSGCTLGCSLFTVKVWEFVNLPNQTVLEESLVHCQLSLSTLISKSTEFNQVHSLQRINYALCIQPHTLDHSTMFARLSVNLPLRVLEEYGMCV